MGRIGRHELAALVKGHQAELFRYMRYLGADRVAAEDLVLAYPTPRGTGPLRVAGGGSVRRHRAHRRGPLRRGHPPWEP